MRNSSFVSILIIATLTSCVTQRKLEYLQDKNETVKAFSGAGIEEYRVQPDDQLYITVNSLDDAAASVFANGQQGAIYESNLQPYGASIMSYAVDQSGYIVLPVLGKLAVKGLTTPEIAQKIKDSLVKILNQPSVKVKLVNRYVAVLGEVRNPGHYVFTKEKMTIYDALGMAGDILDYGDRKSVLLVRTQDNQNVRINVNLLSAEILSSDYYFLRPNDIIYVKPLRARFWGLREFPYSIILSTITTGLLLYNVLAN